MPMGLLVVFLVFFYFSATTAALSMAKHTMKSTENCFSGDSDCPPCPDPQRQLNFTSHLLLSLTKPSFMLPAAEAELFIRERAPSGSVIRMEDPFALHTSLNYFCCHSAAERDTIVGVLRHLSWDALPLNYSHFGCNTDHNNVTVYILMLPDASSQVLLMALIKRIETLVKAAGVAINNPRKQPFHCTLARVRRSLYPVDDVVRQLNSTNLAAGSVDMWWFQLGDHVFEAKNAVRQLLADPRNAVSLRQT
jgi:2'-5' RNA ligase